MNDQSRGGLLDHVLLSCNSCGQQTCRDWSRYPEGEKERLKADHEKTCGPVREVVVRHA